MQGNLIVFEGPDGVGKTTLAQMLVEAINNEPGGNAVYYAFPGKELGTIGNLIYNLHHNPQDYGIAELPEECRQLLHIVAHVDAIKRRILPWLDEGKLVVLDRYWWSTYVYGKVYGVDIYFLQQIINAEKTAWEGIHSDVLFNVQRGRPFDEEPTPTWDRLAGEYAHYAAMQMLAENVVEVHNCDSHETLPILLEECKKALT